MCFRCEVFVCGTPQRTWLGPPKAASPRGRVSRAAGAGGTGSADESEHPLTFLRAGSIIDPYHQIYTMTSISKIFSGFLGKLTPRQREVIVGRFGLDKSGSGETL